MSPRNNKNLQPSWKTSNGHEVIECNAIFLQWNESMVQFPSWIEWNALTCVLFVYEQRRERAGETGNYSRNTHLTIRITHSKQTYCCRWSASRSRSTRNTIKIHPCTMQKGNKTIGRRGIRNRRVKSEKRRRYWNRKTHASQRQTPGLAGSDVVARSAFLGDSEHSVCRNEQ